VPLPEREKKHHRATCFSHRPRSLALIVRLDPELALAARFFFFETRSHQSMPLVAPGDETERKTERPLAKITIIIDCLVSPAFSTILPSSPHRSFESQSPLSFLGRKSAKKGDREAPWTPSRLEFCF
jgi:hypothetical protein